MFLLILFRDIPNETHELAKEVLLCGAVGCHLCTQFSALAASVESEKSQSLIFGCWRRLAMSWSVHSGWSFQQVVVSRGITGSAVAVEVAAATVLPSCWYFFSACQRDAL